MSALTGFVPTTGTIMEFHADAAAGATVDYTGTIGATGWTKVGQIIDYKKLPMVKLDKIEKTLIEDPTKKYKAGQGDPQEFEVECNYDKATYDTAMGIKGLDKAFRIKCVDGSGIGTSGFITEVEINAPKGKNWTISIKGQGSGDVTAIAADA